MLHRMRFRLCYPTAVSTATLCIVLGGSGAIAMGGISTGADVIHGCVNNRTGALRVVHSGQSCRALRKRHGRVVFPGELPIAWNQQGPPGTNGNSGTNGTNGKNGMNGVNGIQGPSGVVGVPLDQEIDGPLPITRVFAKRRSDTALLVTVSGTGFRSTAEGPGDGGVLLGLEAPGTGEVKRFTRLFFTATNEHLALPAGTDIFPSETNVSMPAGMTTLTVSSDSVAPLSTDGNDRFWITVVEVAPVS